MSETSTLPSKPLPLLDRLTPLISEVMGARTGEVFHKFYEYDDEDEVLSGAKALLYEMLGSRLAEQRLRDVLDKNETNQ